VVCALHIGFEFSATLLHLPSLVDLCVGHVHKRALGLSYQLDSTLQGAGSFRCPPSSTRCGPHTFWSLKKAILQPGARPWVLTSVHHSVPLWYIDIMMRMQFSHFQCTTRTHLQHESPLDCAPRYSFIQTSTPHQMMAYTIAIRSWQVCLQLQGAVCIKRILCAEWRTSVSCLVQNRDS
jgi:hypothetical protein